ncbi:MAG: deoxyhypusine synthase [Candidatus Asgardarchaeia archaeon]
MDKSKIRKKLLSKPVKDIDLNKISSFNDLIEQYFASGGFTAKKLSQGVEILEQMVKDKEMTKFLSFPACIIATGTRGVIKEIVKRKWFDVIITTCGTLDHDLARIWRDYYHGAFMMDDKELHKLEINRLGNVLVPNESYGVILEEVMQRILQDIYMSGKNELSTYELVWEIGKRIDSEDSIVYWAYKNKIPVIIPGITDGAVGYQLWLFAQTHTDFRVNVIADEQYLNDIIWESKKTGAFMIGGGISKHHTIWWNQFKDGLDLAVYITTAQEWDGSLSGARLREAVSWGKIGENAKYVTIEGDATVLLPLMILALLERL